MGNKLNKALDRCYTDEILVNIIYRNPREHWAYRDKNGETLLLKACRLNRPKAAMELVKKSYARTLHFQNKTGDTALIWAIQNKMDEVALSLVYTRYARPATVNHVGESAVTYAFKNNMEKVLISMVDLGQIKLEGLLIKACKEGMDKLAIRLIELDKDNLVIHDERGNTPLIMACKKQLSEVALKIIETKLGINWMVNESNETALILACKHKMDEVALKLIESGDANAGIINKHGVTALMMACMNQMSDVALAMIQTGEAKVEYVYHNKTALMLACANGLEDVALEIVENPACQVEVPIEMTAVVKGEAKKSVHYINIATKHGVTAVYLACRNNLKTVANELLEMGATWTATMTSVDTPLIWACKNGMKRVSIKLLEKHICNVFKKDEFGNTARYYALKHGKKMDTVLYKIDQILKDQVGPRVSYRIHKIKVESNQCCICAMEIDEQYALIGCGHSEICLKCIKHLRDHGSLCPICRLKFEDYVRVY